MIKSLLNLLFPAKCLICINNKEQNDICSECWSKLTFITNPYCSICSYPFLYEDEKEAICGNCVISSPLYDRSISSLKYDVYSKKLIHRFKYNDQLHVLDYLVNLMINMGRELIEQADIIIPVPMHKNKLLKRGYNQAALLAMRIASKKKLEYIPQLMIKTKNTTSQAQLNQKQRLKNVKNSIELNPKYKEKIKGRKILLIDDVITTGATINESCKVLRKEDPDKIFVLTLAKKILN